MANATLWRAVNADRPGAVPSDMKEPTIFGRSRHQSRIDSPRRGNDPGWAIEVRRSHPYRVELPRQYALTLQRKLGGLNPNRRTVTPLMTEGYECVVLTSCDAIRSHHVEVLLVDCVCMRIHRRTNRRRRARYCDERCNTEKHSFQPPCRMTSPPPMEAYAYASLDHSRFGEEDAPAPETRPGQVWSLREVSKSETEKRWRPDQSGT